MEMEDEIKENKPRDIADGEKDIEDAEPTLQSRLQGKLRVF